MSLVADYIVSLTNLYGIVHMEKVVEIYNMQNDDKIDVSIVEEIAEDCHQELNEQFSFREDPYFVHESIVRFDEFDLELAKKDGKPFYIPQKSELLKYKDEFYFEKTKEFKALFRYVLTHFTKGNKLMAEELCEDIQLSCQIDSSPSNIFQEFTRRDIVFEDDKQVSDVMDLVINLANNTRIWDNNGHTPQEIFKQYESEHIKAIPRQSHKKVGRNDLCPCGSGKKYKKCCL